jgi:hypothetical protein
MRWVGLLYFPTAALSSGFAAAHSPSKLPPLVLFAAEGGGENPSIPKLLLTPGVVT